MSAFPEAVQNADAPFTAPRNRGGFFWRASMRGRRKYLVGRLPGGLHDHAAADARLGARLAEVNAGGRGGAADLLPARPQPRQLPFAFGTTGLGLPTYFLNSLARRAADDRLFACAGGSGGLRAGEDSASPGKEALFVVLLLGADRALSGAAHAAVLPVRSAQATNSLVGLAIVHTAIQLPFRVYVMRNAFEAVPRELEEAATMDGCNSFQILVHICLPAVVPAMITVSLFAFITSWNELLGGAGDA